MRSVHQQLPVVTETEPRMRSVYQQQTVVIETEVSARAVGWAAQVSVQSWLLKHILHVLVTVKFSTVIVFSLFTFVLF